MDLLSQRYANPYLILDDFTRSGQLHDFSIEVMRMISKEKIHKSRWEFFLHKVWDMSFEDYVAACEVRKDSEDVIMQKEEALQIIDNSNSILEEFTL